MPKEIRLYFPDLLGRTYFPFPALSRFISLFLMRTAILGSLLAGVLLIGGCANSSTLSTRPPCPSDWSASSVTVYEESDVDRPPRFVGGVRGFAQRVRPDQHSETYRGKIGFIVDDVGCVRDPSLVQFESASGISVEIVRAYMTALKESRFHPGMVDGDSVAVYLTTTFRRGPR